jgi:NCS2 family nucleobase:cation symporter-2/xanthine permease XanP
MTLAMALTHVLLIFDGIIFVPNILAKTTQVPSETLRFVTFATIIVASLFTFLQSRRPFGLGAGFILFTGSYSAFLICSIDAVKLGGFQLLGSMALLTVPIVFLYTFFIRFFRHIITPAVGGVVILLIAISLVPIGLDLWVGSAGGASNGEMIYRLGIGGVTVLMLTVFLLLGNTTLRIWSPIIAMVCGCCVALSVGQLHFNHAMAAPWFGLPPMAWPGIELNLQVVHLPLLFAFAMSMIVSMIENTGNIMLVQQISQRNLKRFSYDRIQGGLYCDGLSKVLAGLLGTAVPSIYCDNLPLIEMTGVASKRIGTVGAGLLLILSFMPKVSGIILDMPGPVIGGFLIVIAAMLFQAGIGLVTMTKFDHQHGIILGISLVVGLVAESGDFFSSLIPKALAPMLLNSVAMGGFTAFALSAMVYLIPQKKVNGVFKANPKEFPRVQAMVDAAKKKFTLSPDVFNHLSLCCEEVFAHMIGEDHSDDTRSLTFRIQKSDNGYFVEVVCGHKMDDINNFILPKSLLQAKPEDLKQLGLMLVANYARDVKHVEISGYSYISFLI